MTAHGALVLACMLEASRCGARLFKNNTGVAQYQTGGKVRYGLKVGSADLIGYIPMDGCAVFFSVECKTGSAVPTEQQRMWREAVCNDGGIAIVAREASDVARAIERAREGVPNE